MAAAPQAVQGFRHTLGLTAAASDKTGALTAACGASRGGGFQLSGTWVGTVTFEQSLDAGTTWVGKTVYPANGGAGVTTATANGQWKFPCGGETHVRARCSAFTSGPIVVDASFTAGSDTSANGLGTAGTPAGPVQSVQGVVGGTPLNVTTPSYASAVALTRTADTVLYTANDVPGIDNGGSAGAAALTFASIGDDEGGNILIINSTLRIDLSSVTSGMTSFRLHLYNATPPSALLDNAAWDLPSGDRSAYLGYIDLGTPVDMGSTLFAQQETINKPFVVPSGGALYGYLVTIGSYTPASGTVHTIRLFSVGI